MTLGDEGCLSVPEIYDKVPRHARVTVRALDRDGEPLEFDADGLLAVCVQHEMDHLIGKVFVEYLSPLKRDAHQDQDAEEGARRSARLSRGGGRCAVVFAGTPEFARVALARCTPPASRSRWC